MNKNEAVEKAAREANLELLRHLCGCASRVWPIEGQADCVSINNAATRLYDLMDALDKLVKEEK